MEELTEILVVQAVAAEAMAELVDLQHQDKDMLVETEMVFLLASLLAVVVALAQQVEMETPVKLVMVEMV